MQCLKSISRHKRRAKLERNTKNAVDADSRVQLARKTAYSLLGPGLHARTGMSPLVTVKIYGIELQRCTKTDLQKMEAYQRKILKHLQGLPDRTASVAMYILSGCETIEAIIDRNTLSMFYNH